MFYLYPANKMENLLVLLDKIQRLSPLTVFSQEIIVVQNAGMQHWLNMSLAQRRGVSMNIHYALPSQYLWRLIRSLATNEHVPEQSPYSREVLAWRIDNLLAKDDVVNNKAFLIATQYWRSEEQPKNQHNTTTTQTKYTDNECLKRYQLACQLADLYEQYLIFRPEWIHAWHNGEFVAYDQLTQQKQCRSDQQTLDESTAIWQGKLWQLLVQQQPYDPKQLVASAIATLNSLDLSDDSYTTKHLLPRRLSFFGINAMAPIWLEFINALSQKIDIHFFHLNPCFDYWGDVVSDKKALDVWINSGNFSTTNRHSTLDNKTLNDNITLNENVEHNSIKESDIFQTVGNPLLANLGQQGREFISLLTAFSTINIDVFESVVNDDNLAENEKSSSVLARIQEDILTLKDARFMPYGMEGDLGETGSFRLVDDSITITSAHSALREVQGLHDWLLHQFNHHKSLTPKDVLVMCPQVEQYAPYVNAVFTRGWQELSDDVPPLPCSIADRISKDAEPLVAAFSELLTLPDSRFHVSSIMALLRLPAMQKRFDINLEDIEKISQWLDVACVHWGIDKNHKQEILAKSEYVNLYGNMSGDVGDTFANHKKDQNLAGNDYINNSFTWQQGLSRLMRGFAFADHSVLYQNQMLLPNVEGNDAELLGKLMLIIEQLQLSAKSMTRARNAMQWQQYLFALLNTLFDDDNDNGLMIVQHAIALLMEYCQHAGYHDNISLAVIREFLNNHFSQPDPGRQFMVGQVTFCSMLPMRSIPFKIIAVLGLNDGEFPRQRQPLNFDLMATTQSKIGDRSRRGDDRYLFLEALISARQALYLSYQGRNIKNNKERQPSLVLKELMEYLARGYGWRLLGLNKDVNTDSTVQTNSDTQRQSVKPSQTEDIRQLPMQAFSEQNYLGKFASFDANWLALGQGKSAIGSESQQANKNETTVNTNNTELNKHSDLATSDIIRFYQHPSRYYAQHVLYLYLEQENLALTDSEPFVINRLDSYLIRENFLHHYLEHHYLQHNNNSSDADNITPENIALSAKLSGKLPHLPTTDEFIQGWQQDSEQFSGYIFNELHHQVKREPLFQEGEKFQEGENSAHVLTHLDCTITLDVPRSLINDELSELTFDVNEQKKQILLNAIPAQVKISTNLTIANNQLVFYRSSSAKGKDLFTVYLHQLLLQVAQSDAEQIQLSTLVNIHQSIGFYFDTKKQKPEQYYFANLVDAKRHLQRLIILFYLGQTQPLLLNSDLAYNMFNTKKVDQDKFTQFWSYQHSAQPFGADAYHQYFWQQCPSYHAIYPLLEVVYKPLFEQLQPRKKTGK